MAKTAVKNVVQLNVFTVVEKAVEEGAAYGVRRAYKHTDSPSQDEIIEQVRQGVLNALCEVIDFEGV